MADHIEEVYEKYVRPLSTAERLRLLEMTVHDLVLTAPHEVQKRSIMELRGLGKEIWQGVDAQKYVDSFRKEWDHPGGDNVQPSSN